MKVFFIGAGAGDPELLTIKAQRVLKDCKVVIYTGSLVNSEILRYAKGAEVYNSAQMTLDEVLTVMEKAYADNHNLARIHTGDPSIYGAIQEQFDHLTKKEIPFEVIPGVSSFSAATASLKRELTLPDISQTVILTRLEGRTKVPEKERLANLAKHQSSMVIFLSVQMIEEVVDELKEGYDLKTPVAVVYKASWPDELILTGSLGDIVDKVREAGIKSTALILVGDFLDGNYAKSKLYDQNFCHNYRRELAKDSKKAILVVSFGTSYQKTSDITIKACEEDIAKAFSDYEVRRAFTSRAIIKILKSRDQISIDDPRKALEKLKVEGYSEVIVQPLHFIAGKEYHDLLRDLLPFKDDFKRLLIGKPLLNSIEDYVQLVAALKMQLPALKAGEGVILMGHGSYHSANSSYPALDYVLKENGYDNVFVATVAGYPKIDHVIKKLVKRKIKKVTLMPLMLVAGDHALNDMAGDAKNSWKIRLREKGFDVDCYLHGLGENSGVRRIYLNKVKEVGEIQ